MEVVSVTGIGHGVAVDLDQRSGRSAGQEGGESKDKLEPEAHEDKLELIPVFHSSLLSDEVVCTVRPASYYGVACKSGSGLREAEGGSGGCRWSCGLGVCGGEGGASIR